MQKLGISTVVRRNGTGRIYGINFIDHNSKTVWNGSRLGKEFSANAFNDWWNHQKQTKYKTKNNSKIIKVHKKYTRDTSEKLHKLLDFLNKTKDSYAKNVINRCFLS